MPANWTTLHELLLPALDALGLSPESVTSPSTPRELVSDLLNAVDQNGVLQHGLAIETAPFRLIGIRTNLRDYKREDLSGAICRWVYNETLSLRKSSWEQDKKTLSLYDTHNLLPLWKKEHPELKSVYSQVLQNVTERVELAFQGFFRRVKQGEKEP